MMIVVAVIVVVMVTVVMALTDQWLSVAVLKTRPSIGVRWCP